MTSPEETRQVRTVCPAHCGVDACGIIAHVKGDRVVRLEPADFPDPKARRICLRGLSSLDITYHPDRLKYPLKRVGERGEGKFERISWEEALETIADRFRKITDRYGWRAIAWTLGGPGSGTTKFGAYLRLASLTQSTRVSAWGYGDAGLPCGSRVIFGTHLPYFLLAGSFLSGTKIPEMIVVWGSNPAECTPFSSMRRIMDAKEKGAYVVVIDPRFTVTASKADAYVGLKPGTDSALALGLLHVIFHRNLQDEAFIRKHTVGPYLVRNDNGRFLRSGDLGWKEPKEYIVWDPVQRKPTPRNSAGMTPALTGSFTVNGIECKTAMQLLMDLAEQYPPERAARITGVSAEIIEKLARRIGQSESVAFVTHMGPTRTYHGHISFRSLATVASVTGNLTVSLRGGHRPAVLNWNPFLNANPGQPSYHRLGILQLYEAVISGRPFQVKALWFSFINFLNQCVNSNKIAKEIFPKLEFMVAAELFMTPTARYCDIVLPACSFLEFSDLIPFPDPYVQLQQKVIEPLYECKSDVDIATALAARLGLAEYFTQGEDGFIDMILDSRDPSMEGISRENLEKGPMILNKIPDLGQDIDVPFSTPSGKIELYSEACAGQEEALPVFKKPLETPLETEGRKYPLAFIQGHSRFRTHSMFANVRSLLDMNPNPVLEINPRDAAKRGISEGNLVTVFNDRSRTTLRARVTEGVRPGVVNITQGWWIDQFKEGSVNHLTHDTINPIQEVIYEPNMHMNDVAVEVVKAEA
jgi:anaerobic selenocysteine-containing dehydrogenase